MRSSMNAASSHHIALRYGPRRRGDAQAMVPALGTTPRTGPPRQRDRRPAQPSLIANARVDSTQPAWAAATLFDDDVALM
jgi:hypothetical protein